MPRSDALVSLSKSSPIVRNTILAITACHLRHVSPGVLSHRIAEHFQQSLALREYQKALYTPRKELGQSGVNGLMLSAILLNILAFVLPESETAAEDGEPNVDTSWIYSPHDDRLGWLLMQAGLRPLIKSSLDYIEESMNFLNFIFLGTAEESWTPSVLQPGLSGVPEMWIEFFELQDFDYDCDGKKERSIYFSDDQNSVAVRSRLWDTYHVPVVILVRLRDLEPVRLNSLRNIQFLIKIGRDLRAMLYDRDERALWLFGYWLGLLHRFEGMWWCKERVRRDYKAIRIWLGQLHLTERPGLEGDRWREMMQEYDSAPKYARTNA